MPASKNLISAVVFILIGIGAVAIASGYDLGSARRMGPGYFPILVGGVMIFLGSLLAIGELRQQTVDLFSGDFHFRPLLLITLAVVLFAVLIDLVGLVLSTLVMVVVAHLGDRHARLRETIIIAIVLPAVITALFVFGLSIPLRIGFW